MSDKELQELMDLTSKTRESYLSVLTALEEEYKKRFGNYPSDLDDDFFISEFHYGQSKNMTVKEMTESAKDRALKF